MDGGSNKNLLGSGLFKVIFVWVIPLLGIRNWLQIHPSHNAHHLNSSCVMECGIFLKIGDSWCHGKKRENGGTQGERKGGERVKGRETGLGYRVASKYSVV